MINIDLITNEFKRNLKLLLIYSLVWFSMVLMVMALFDVINEQADEITQAFSNFPEGFLDAFGTDLDSFAEYEGYITSQVISLLLLANSILAAYLGANTIGKEISINSISALLTKPLSRINIYLSKFLALSIVLFSINILLGVGTYLSTILLTKVNDPPLDFLFVSFIAPSFMQLMFLAFGMMIGALFNEGIGLISGAGISIMGMVVDALSGLEGVPVFIRFLTPYYYIDLMYISENSYVPTPQFWFFPIWTLGFLILGAWWFQRRDINV